MNKIAWIIFSAVVVLGLGALILATRLNSPTADVANIDANAIVSANDANGQTGDHVFGTANSKVILVEYGDFQCPSCGGAHPQLKAVSDEYSDHFAFVYRNFPLTSIHPNARAAAAAAEAAAKQNKYWEMHDLLYERQSDWENLSGTERTDKFAGYAKSLGLNRDDFLAAIASATVNDKISFDQALGRKQNVTATPTFYLNGEKVSDDIAGALVHGDSAPLKKAIDDLL